ncbi:hypothetical protein [Eleftheria terrae]|uniref:hypothetical protein n=1 Tax=Eleftheria terrae TaxID=1597781 RepID=UPI00263B0545|nr:hypothetical protein [Eleftheria terrae]WKB50561.1 hypothetical protein N7L95_00135 [Eleftheria terrae]
MVDTKRVLAKFGWTTMLIVSGTAVGAFLGANQKMVWYEGMLRDSAIASILSAETREALIKARPQGSMRIWHPDGAPHYTYNGQHVPVVTTLLRVGCAPGGEHVLCGASAGDRRDERQHRFAAAFGFWVIDGELVTYSSGDAREHPAQFRQEIEDLAAQQIALWRDAVRLSGTGDSL